MTWHGWRSRWALLGVAACALVAVWALLAERRQAAPAEVLLENQAETFNVPTLREWVSLADAIVVARVTNEQTYDPTDAEQRRSGEYLRGRRVAWTIEARLWERHDGTRVPTDIRDVDTLGSWVSHGRERKLFTRYQPRVEVGGRYLFPIVFLVEEDLWVPLSAGMMEIDPSTNRPVLGREMAFSTARPALAGKSPQEIAAILEHTRPHPNLAGLDPLERQAAISNTPVEELRQARGLPRNTIRGLPSQSRSTKSVTS